MLGPALTRPDGQDHCMTDSEKSAGCGCRFDLFKCKYLIHLFRGQFSTYPRRDSRKVSPCSVGVLSVGSFGNPLQIVRAVVLLVKVAVVYFQAFAAAYERLRHETVHDPIEFLSVSSKAHTEVPIFVRACFENCAPVKHLSPQAVGDSPRQALDPSVVAYAVPAFEANDRLPSLYSTFVRSCGLEHCSIFWGGCRKVWESREPGGEVAYNSHSYGFAQRDVKMYRQLLGGVS